MGIRAGAASRGRPRGGGALVAPGWLLLLGGVHHGEAALADLLPDDLVADPVAGLKLKRVLFSRWQRDGAADGLRRWIVVRHAMPPCPTHNDSIMPHGEASEKG